MTEQIPSHDYARFASDYSNLGIEKTYYLYYRDVPALLDKYCTGKNALDFGCAAGRFTRFLKTLGFDAVGVDINSNTLKEAIRKDPSGEYALLERNALPFDDSSFDLVFQSSVAEEIADLETLKAVFKQISRVLKDTGIAIVVTASVEGRVGEWSSFICPATTKLVKSGDQVKLLIRDTDIVFYDFVWFPSDFVGVFKDASLNIIERHRPLATGEEPFRWYQELTVPFWDVYVLAKAAKAV